MNNFHNDYGNNYDNDSQIKKKFDNKTHLMNGSH